MKFFLVQFKHIFFDKTPLIFIIYNNFFYIVSYILQYTISDSKIQRIDNQVFTSNLDGFHGYRLHLQTQRSVIVGVKKMFQKYKNKKWEEIQELSALILQSRDPSYPNYTTLPDSQLEPDTMATELTEMFCVYFRTA